MSDARSLLRARKADNAARINHPYAAYNASGQLRCNVCVIAIKNATAWSGHLGSKTHRTNVAQLKAKEAEAKEKIAGKRKSPGNELEESVDHDGHADGNASKKQKRPTEFPTDFFSDPHRIVTISSEEEDEENENDANLPPDSSGKQPTEKAAVDIEWEEFQRTVINASAPMATDQKAQEEESGLDSFNRATVFAEAEIFDETPEGFPKLSNDEPAATETVKPKELTDEELAEKKTQEERELIMDRLLAEEQAQEDADNRVLALKSRLDGIKKRKEAARLMKQSH